MANIQTVLKDEISRIARKEIKAATASLKKAVATYRSEIAALKRRVSELERLAKRMAKTKAPVAEVQPKGDDIRFHAQGFAAHRQRLGLSAADMAKLIGASTHSVYTWEKGQAKPRKAYLLAISDLRTMGKKETQTKLAELSV
jgi:DNA-binding transcriptional regulator YiaG